ncbi:hypothetical protein [Saccharopolyspora sp. 5N708]|uniref:hypothetical protein n=1 Tax=Saccharopolyspora sp. 5N708 TaxID=3457424 RepID=UPI003FCF7965
MATASSAAQHTSHRTQQSRSTSAAHPTRAKQQAAASMAIPLPRVTAEMHTYQIPLPNRANITSAAETVRGQLPSRDQAMFYGGLAAGVAFSLIEWPVALAIGVGNALMRRTVQQQGTKKR